MVDPSQVLALRPTIMDYQQLQSAFKQKQDEAALAQATGAQDLQSKKNIYATQVLSGATAPIAVDANKNPIYSQNNYNTALQHLAQQGIDISTFSPDVNQAAQQVQAARLAQSPLGSLISTANKLDTNNNTVTLAGGTLPVDANAITKAVMGGNMAALTSGVQPKPQQAAPIPQATQAPVHQPTSALPSISPVDARNPGMMLPVNAGLATQKQSNIALPSINDPKYKGMTASAKSQAFTADLDAVKADPAYQALIAQNNASATKTGQDNAGNQDAANKAAELTNRLTQNLEAMKKINNDVPSDGFIPSGAKTYMSQALGANGLGTGAAAAAANQWDQINNQQVVSEIQQFLASGGAGARINQTLDRIMQAASAIHKGDLPASREAQINNALAELSNKNVSAQNLAADGNGGEKQQYNALPVVTSQQLQQAFDNKKSGGLPIISSPSDPAFAQLPSGAKFTTPDGEIRTKH